MSSATTVNYEIFNICKQCDSILFREKTECPNCKSNHFISFTEKLSKTGVKRSWTSIILVIGAIILGFAIAGPAGLLLVYPIIAIGNAIGTSGENSEIGKRIKYKTDAVNLIKNQAANQKSEITTHYKEGANCFQAGDFEKAIVHFEKGQSLGDYNNHLLYMLAIAYYNRDEYDRALPIFEKLGSEKAFPEAEELWARTIVVMGISEQSIIPLKNIISSTQDKALADYITLSIADYYHGMKDLDSNDIHLIESARLLQPEEPKYLETLLWYWLNQNRPENVIQASQQFPWENHSHNTFLLWAKAYAALSDTSNLAIDVYKKALLLYPEEIDIRVKLIEALVIAKNYDSALEYAQEGLKISPNIMLQHMLALIYMSSEQMELSIAAFQKIMQMEDFESYISRAVIYRQLSNCFMKKNMLELAFKQIMQSDRSKATLNQLYKLGELYIQKGDFNNAMRCFEEIYAVDVGFKDVSAKIEVLQSQAAN